MSDAKLPIQRLFITGGAGYVGAVLVPKLLAEGYAVTVYDLMLYGDDVLPQDDALTLIKGDIRDQAKLCPVLAGHDAVIHLACISNDPSFELDPDLGKSINYQPSENPSTSTPFGRLLRPAVMLASLASSTLHPQASTESSKNPTSMRT